MSLLVGDFGGTNARLALVDGPGLTRPWSRPCETFQGPEDAIGAYLAETGVAPLAAVLAVTGPLAGGEANFANNGWRFSEATGGPRLPSGGVR